tara:strand:+ start:300 stop:659 length:360 start_codon:yes stop_codon:yes gene_type:complete
MRHVIVFKKMKYVKPVQDIIDTVLGRSPDIEIVTTFKDYREALSCIIHRPGTDKFGLLSVNVDGSDDDISCFVFNGKLYDYCKAEGFSKQQMVEDQSFENRVLTTVSVDEFLEMFEDEG